MVHRIAVIFEYPSLNGGENSMLRAMQVADRNAFEFVAIAPPTGMLADALRESAIEHVPFRWIDGDGIRFPRKTIQDEMLATISRASPSLVHANSLSMGRLTGSIQPQLTIPCTTHVRDIMKVSLGAIRDVNANRQIIAVSHATRDFHVQQGMDAARSCVVYNTVDGERFKRRAATGSLRRELNLPKENFITLTIGQIGLRKAQDVLAEAAPLIASRIDDVHFVIVGERNSTKPESIEFERCLSAQFEKAGLADHYHQIGYRADVESLMNEADLLVHTAKQEPLGRVLLEAAASGLPIVTTDVGGTREILSNDVSAKLVPAGDAPRLADAVIEMLSDPDARKRFTAEARKTIDQKFSSTSPGTQLGEVWPRTLNIEQTD